MMGVGKAVRYDISSMFILREREGKERPRLIVWLEGLGLGEGGGVLLAC